MTFISVNDKSYFSLLWIVDQKIRKVVRRKEQVLHTFIISYLDISCISLCSHYVSDSMIRIYYTRYTILDISLVMVHLANNAYGEAHEH